MNWRRYSSAILLLLLSCSPKTTGVKTELGPYGGTTLPVVEQHIGYSGTFICDPPSSYVDWYTVWVDNSWTINCEVKSDWSMNCNRTYFLEGCHTATAQACKYGSTGIVLCSDWCEPIEFEYPKLKKGGKGWIPAMLFLLFYN